MPISFLQMPRLLEINEAAEVWGVRKLSLDWMEWMRWTTHPWRSPLGRDFIGTEEGTEFARRTHSVSPKINCQGCNVSKTHQGEKEVKNVLYQLNHNLFYCFSISFSLCSTSSSGLHALSSSINRGHHVFKDFTCWEVPGFICIQLQTGLGLHNLFCLFTHWLTILRSQEKCLRTWKMWLNCIFQALAVILAVWRSPYLWLEEVLGNTFPWSVQGSSPVGLLLDFFWWHGDKGRKSRHSWDRRTVWRPGTSYGEAGWAWSSVLLTFGRMGPWCILYQMVSFLRSRTMPFIHVYLLRS